MFAFCWWALMALTPSSVGDEDSPPPSTPLNINGGGGGGASGSGSGNDSGVVEVVGLKHNPGIFLHWTAEEQAILEDTLPKVASDPPLLRYAKIAMLLKDKTTRDVALRVRWMIMQTENGKRRKEDHTSIRKNKDKKEKGAVPSAKSSSPLVTASNGPRHALSLIPVDADDEISYKAIGGEMGWLLEQNAQAFNQISANFAASKIYDNIDLLCQARDNIKKLLNNLNDEPKAMKQMPPLPVKLNEELAKSILPMRLNEELANPTLPGPSASP
ncbi:uncharacterized protein LOC100852665 isoform X2 [Vitis vinifera]|uniref:uncharacterized protein LOC100852665 isoform X2 n=1 Tax=Vitis vinifera TaxID=29760 RepID=UPI0028832BCC|nr:uncharacterized protein LOC100852665 isoform X2 [Vitis vinifera]